MSMPVSDLEAAGRAPEAGGHRDGCESEHDKTARHGTQTFLIALLRAISEHGSATISL